MEITLESLTNFILMHSRLNYDKSGLYITDDAEIMSVIKFLDSAGYWCRLKQLQEQDKKKSGDL